eukprot:6093409-Amphidinium_carterae.1
MSVKCLSTGAERTHTIEKDTCNKQTFISSFSLSLQRKGFFFSKQSFLHHVLKFSDHLRFPDLGKGPSCCRGSVCECGSWGSYKHLLRRERAIPMMAYALDVIYMQTLLPPHLYSTLCTMRTEVSSELKRLEGQGNSVAPRSHGMVKDTSIKKRFKSHVSGSIP